jgi:flagellar basal body rod protein FlgG
MARGNVMKINGQVDYVESGITSSLRAMYLQTEIMAIHSDNINGFDKVGYQRKDPVVSSFTEYIGEKGLSISVDDKPGRMAMSNNPLDLALSNKGYFQVQGNEGTKLTRDGRFHYDKNGNLLTLEDEKVIGNDGMPIVLPFIPDSPNDINIDLSGKIKIVDRANNKITKVGQLSVVSTNGVAILDPGVRQGFTEDSNVSLSEEAMSTFPILKTFDATKAMFQQTYSLVTTAVQKLTQM